MLKGGDLIKKFIIGVMGGGQFVNPEDEKYAYQIGAMAAQEGCILLNGGRDSGVMEASAKGAKDHGGITVGIIPGENPEWASQYIDIPIITGMGMARNVINILSSDLIIALPGKAGTISEIAMALKNGKEIVLFRFDVGNWIKSYLEEGKIHQFDQLEQLRSLIVEKIKIVNTAKRGIHD